MQIAVLTFDGYNELDSFVASAVLNRLGARGWKAHITSPSASVGSMHGLTVQAQQPLSFAREADAVIVGSGIRSRDIVRDAALMAHLKLDPKRQLIGAQSSGALILARLGLLDGAIACADPTTRPWLHEAGVKTVEQPFIAHGNVATAGGCFSSLYLATWILWRCAGEAAAREVLHEVAPVGEKQVFVERAVSIVARYALALR